MVLNSTHLQTFLDFGQKERRRQTSVSLLYILSFEIGRPATWDDFAATLTELRIRIEEKKRRQTCNNAPLILDPWMDRGGRARTWTFAGMIWIYIREDNNSDIEDFDDFEPDIGRRCRNFGCIFRAKSRRQT